MCAEPTGERHSGNRGTERRHRKSRTRDECPNFQLEEEASRQQSLATAEVEKMSESEAPTNDLTATDIK